LNHVTAFVGRSFGIALLSPRGGARSLSLALGGSPGCIVPGNRSIRITQLEFRIAPPISPSFLPNSSSAGGATSDLTVTRQVPTSRTPLDTWPPMAKLLHSEARFAAAFWRKRSGRSCLQVQKSRQTAGIRWRRADQD